MADSFAKSTCTTGNCEAANGEAPHLLPETKRKNGAPITLRLHRLLDSDRDSNRCADHRIVAHADQAHHLHMRGH